MKPEAGSLSYSNRRQWGLPAANHRRFVQVQLEATHEGESLNRKRIAQRTGPVLQVAGFVIIVVGIHLAAPVVVPTLAALVVAVAASGLSRVGERYLPRRLSIWLALTITLGIVFSLGAFLMASTTDLVANLPQYQTQWVAFRRGVVMNLSSYGLHSLALSLQQLNLEAHLGRWVVDALQVSLQLLSGVVVVSILSGFLMLEIAGSAEKAERIRELTGIDIFSVFSGRLQLQRYLGIKTAASAATGAAAGLACVVFSVPHAGFFALLTFSLNYIPTIGSIIAALPPVCLALVVLGWPTALFIAGSYLGINLLIGNVLEPRWLGQSFKLSPLAVVLSMLFWGAVLGPVGALVSVPLTVMSRIMAENSPRYAWLAVLLESPSATSGAGGDRIQAADDVASARTNINPLLR